MHDPRFELVLGFLRRIRAGETLTVEGYLAEHPELGPKIVPILKEALNWPREEATNTLQLRLEESGFFQLPEGAGDTQMLTPTGGNGVEFDKRYNQKRLLGEGGYGKVFLVEDTMHESELLALKVIRKVHTVGDVEQRFRNEIRVLRALNHRGIPMIFNDGKTEEGEIYYTMSYVEGRTLEDILRKEAPLPPERIIRLSLQLLDVLIYAHERGIVHRDLKPSNIIITGAGSDDEQVQVLDFGIAKVLRHEGVLEQAQTMLTQVPLGTPHYMAPEQVRGQVEDGRTDLYALGIIIYQMCSGRLPFQGKTSMEILIARLEQSPKLLEGDEAPKWLRDLIQRLLKREKEKRPTATETKEMLEVAQSGAPTTSRRIPIMVAGAVALLLFVGWLIWWGPGKTGDVEAAAADRGSQGTPVDDPPQEPPRDPGEDEGISLEQSGDLTREADDAAGRLEEEPSAPEERGPAVPEEDEGAAAEEDEPAAPQVVPATEGAAPEDDEPATNEVDDSAAREEDRESEPELLDPQSPDPPPASGLSFLEPRELRELGAGERLHSNVAILPLTYSAKAYPYVEYRWIESGNEEKVLAEKDIESQIAFETPGEYLITAKDMTGDQNTLAQFIVVYDDAPPVCTELQIEGAVLEDDQRLVGRPSPTMSGQAFDDPPGEFESLELTYRLAAQTEADESKPILIGVDSNEEFVHELDLDREDGTYVVTLTPRDAAGNSESFPNLITVDTTVPAITFEGSGYPATPLVTETYLGPEPHEPEGSELSTENDYWELAGVVRDEHMPAELSLDYVEEQLRAALELKEAIQVPLSGNGFSKRIPLAIGNNRVRLRAEDRISNAITYELDIVRNPPPVTLIDVRVEGAEKQGSVVFSHVIEQSPIRSYELPLPTSDSVGLGEATTVRLQARGRPEVAFWTEDERVEISPAGDGQSYQCTFPASHTGAVIQARVLDWTGTPTSLCELDFSVARAKFPRGFEPVPTSEVNDEYWFAEIRHPKLQGLELAYVRAGDGVGPFYIGKYEVTWEQYGIKGNDLEKATRALPYSSSYTASFDHPVVNVEHKDTEAFCRQMGGRLPKLDEWIYAAVEGSNEYPWGPDWEKGKCNSEAAGRPGPTNGLGFPRDKSWCGAFNMAGNVSEWCTGEGGAQVRGGHWESRKESCEARASKTARPSERVGFRILVDAIP